MSTPATPKITWDPVMIKEQDLAAAVTPPLDPWSGWAKLMDAPAADEVDEPLEVPATTVIEPASPEPESPDGPEMTETLKLTDTPELTETPEAPEPASPPAELGRDLGAAVAQLTAELADERRRREAAEDARREAESRQHSAEIEATRMGAEIASARARIGELERDRDEVIRRAEELLTAVRDRADQRLAAELDVTRRHWSELLAEERSRVGALESERAALAQRVEDAWLATAVLRRARPLRLRDSEPTTPAEAEEEVLEAFDEYETDPAFAAQSPDVADEIANLRQRLRARRNKPPDMPAVEDGVDQLRESRLARDAATKGRRRR
jgi:hypothetical protein